MLAEIVAQVIRCITLAGPMTDDDDAACPCQRARDCLIERDVFRCPLSARCGLVFVCEVMEKMVRVVRPDRFFGGVLRICCDVVNLRFVVVDDDHEVRHRIVSRRRRHRTLFRRPPDMREKLPQLNDVSSFDVLGVRLAHKVNFAADAELEFVVGSPVYVTDFVDERNDVIPFEVVRRRMTKERFQGPLIASGDVRALVRWNYFALRSIGFHDVPNKSFVRR